MPRIDVQLPGHCHPILIEDGLLEQVGHLLSNLRSSQRVMLVMDANVADVHGLAVKRSLSGAGFEVICQSIVAEEAKKTLDTVRTIYESMLNARLERGSCIIALGGGIAGDIAGFAAATYLRGIGVIQVPTTLLAMVDAAIGGKTGVNFAQESGSLVKNVIGAFWHPWAVVSDPATLRTLSERDFRCGLAECVKHGMIADAALLKFIEDRVKPLLARESDVLTELIVRSASIKAAIVQEDERESAGIGRRALLNLGHTFAHAFESFQDLNLRHGEAVAIGLIAAVHIAVELKRMSDAEAKQVRDLLEAIGLPLQLSRRIAVQQIMDAMGHDKKIADGKLRFVLPIGLGKAEVVKDVPHALVERALAEIGAA